MKKSIPKFYVQDNSTFITLLKWQIYGNREQITGCQRLETGEGRDVFMKEQHQDRSKPGTCVVRVVIYEGN